VWQARICGCSNWAFDRQFKSHPSQRRDGLAILPLRPAIIPSRHSFLAHSAIDVYLSTKEATGIRIGESANASAEQLKSVPA
jgi:hypothetical protein